MVSSRSPSSARPRAPRPQLGDDERGRDAVLVAHDVRTDGVAERLLVADRQTARAGGGRMIHLKPVSVSAVGARRPPPRSGPSSVDEPTVVDEQRAGRIGGGGAGSRPSSAPISSPVQHALAVGRARATASRSASGSLASSTSAPVARRARARRSSVARLLRVREARPSGSPVGLGLRRRRRPARRSRRARARAQRRARRRRAAACRRCGSPAARQSGERGDDRLDVARRRPPAPSALAAGAERHRPPAGRRAAMRRRDLARRRAGRSARRPAPGRPCSRCPAAGCGWP